MRTVFRLLAFSKKFVRIFVQFYELATGVLEERSFSDVYGVKNLYRDASSMQDIDELEDKLAVLPTEGESIAPDAASHDLKSNGTGQ